MPDPISAQRLEAIHGASREGLETRCKVPACTSTNDHTQQLGQTSTGPSSRNHKQSRSHWRNTECRWLVCSLSLPPPVRPSTVTVIFPAAAAATAEATGEGCGCGHNHAAIGQHTTTRHWKQQRYQSLGCVYRIASKYLCVLSGKRLTRQPRADGLLVRGAANPNHKPK